MRRRACCAGMLLCGLLGVVVVGADPPPPQPDPVAVFKRLDTNGDGKISWDEFQQLVQRRPRLKDNPELAKRLFDRFDANKDGYLSLDEFKNLIEQTSGKAPPTEPKTEPKTPPVVKDAPPTADQVAFFEKKIRPVLADSCFSCHSKESGKSKGGLLLDTRDAVLKGGANGPALVPGEPNKSLLIKALRYHNENLHMPPKGKLPDAVIADFEQWVRMGAPDPRTGGAVARHDIDIEKGRRFWAFQPPRKHAAPRVRDTAWPRSDVDRFLLAAMEAKGVKPVADADRATLLRRVTFDLTGLPPTPEEVDAFVNDKAPDAYEKVVDRLLASPRFGERWGRHWLDVARYAESSGKEVNINYPQAWRYRDYVIRSFNDDKPFDRFAREQLAGDLLPAANDRQQAEQLTATGFLAIGPKSHNERLPLHFELDVADEQIDATTQAFLGLTVACARCHDHKFDPIPQKDYYALAGIFRSTETCYGTVPLIQNRHPSPLLTLSPTCGQPSALPPLTAADRDRLTRQIDDLKAE